MKTALQSLKQNQSVYVNPSDKLKDDLSELMTLNVPVLRFVFPSITGIILCIITGLLIYLAYRVHFLTGTVTALVNAARPVKACQFEVTQQANIIQPLLVTILVLIMAYVIWNKLQKRALTHRYSADFHPCDFYNTTLYITIYSMYKPISWPLFTVPGPERQVDFKVIDHISAISLHREFLQPFITITWHLCSHHDGLQDNFPIPIRIPIKTEIYDNVYKALPTAFAYQLMYQAPNGKRIIAQATFDTTQVDTRNYKVQIKSTLDPSLMMKSVSLDQKNDDESDEMDHRLSATYDYTW